MNEVYDETIKYYKGRYMLAFYKDTEDKTDERFIISFDNPIDICKFKKLPLTDNNIKQIQVELYHALKREPSTTRMLDGSTMKVYLIDMLEEKEEQERRDRCMAIKKFVKISSTINIEVYASLEAIEIVTASNRTANAKSGWAKIRVLFTEGTSWYPSEVLEWESVKRLAAKEILNIGQQSDTIDDPEVLAKAEEEKKRIKKGVEALAREKEKVAKAAEAFAEKAKE